MTTKERLSRWPEAVIGATIAVHRELRPGLLKLQRPHPLKTASKAFRNSLS